MAFTCASQLFSLLVGDIKRVCVWPFAPLVGGGGSKATGAVWVVNVPSAFVSYAQITLKATVTVPTCKLKVIPGY